jgi:predicted nucleic acid-binding protein
MAATGTVAIPDLCFCCERRGAVAGRMRCWSQLQTPRGLALEDIDAVLDALCTTAEQRQLEPDWIPRMIDLDDEPLLQLAVEAQVPVIVTRNARHLNLAKNFGIEVLTLSRWPGKLPNSPSRRT